MNNTRKHTTQYVIRYTIQALIFDFDGLILDTEEPIYQSWLELYRDFGCDLPLAEWVVTIGKAPAEHDDPFDLLEEKLGRSLDRRAFAPRRRQREDQLIAAQPILPGVEALINEAERLGVRLGVASSSSRKWVHAHMTRLGLVEHFEVIVCSDDVEKTKPDPALYRLAVERLGVRAGNAVALEDSPNGITAAKRAGLFCVAVPNPLTRQLSFEQADVVLGSLEEVRLGDLLLDIGY